MLTILALSLLGIGATAFLIDEIDDDDNNGRASPSTPGEDEPETGGPDPEPDAPVTGGPGPLPDSEDGGLISGTESADALTGTDASEPILSGLGDDVIRAGAGDDVVGADAGDDRVFGEAGEDTLLGQAGNDFLRGGADDDVLIDTEGSDTLRGDTGDDVIFAAGISDPGLILDGVLDPSQAPDPDDFSSINDVPGFDFSQETDDAPDVVDGGAGSDVIFFGNGDTVTGGEGLDIFFGGTPLIEGDPATITDFDAQDETLVFTTPEGTDPSLAITFDGADATVLLGGSPAVLLPGVGADFSSGNIEIISI